MTFRNLETIKRFVPDYAGRGWSLTDALGIAMECEEEKERNPAMGDGEVLFVVERRWRGRKNASHG